MAQKKNPITSENVGGLARIVRSMLYSAYENNLQWHEKTCNSSNERVILPQFYILLEYILIKTENVFANLFVNEERMKKNLESAGGLPMAEFFVIELGKTELGRQASHELVRTITMEAESEGVTFADLVRENKIVKEKLGKEKINFVLICKLCRPFRRNNRSCIGCLNV